VPGDQGEGTFPPVDPIMAAYLRQQAAPPLTGAGVDPSWPAPAPAAPPTPTAPVGWPAPAPPVASGAIPYGAAGYGAPAHPAPPYGAPAYPAPPYGPPGYGAPAYGAPRAGGEYDPFRGSWSAPSPRWSRRARTLTVVAVVATVVLVVSLAGVGVTAMVNAARNRSEQQARATTQLQAALPALEAFVARDTGRPWKHPVKAKVLDDSAFVDTLDHSRGDFPDEPASDQDDTGVTFAAMGLASDPNDYWDASSTGVDDNVTGFYDDSVETLYVRGSAWTPAVEDTLVHELTHADQDQSFDLAKIMGATSTVDETPNTLQAVIEGEATMVERDYYRTQPQSWQDAVDADNASGTDSDVRVADVQGAFPYVMGEPFVEALRKHGGTAAVDKAFLHPPAYSRDLQDPSGWLAGTLPAVEKVPQPALVNTHSSEVEDIGVLGAEGVWLAVAAVDTSRSPGSPDLSAMSGWTGDTYVATDHSYDDGSGDYTGPFCFVDDMRFVDGAARTRALEFATPWTSSAHVEVQLEGDRAVRLSRCSP
jgi:hypothetical protein